MRSPWIYQATFCIALHPLSGQFTESATHLHRCSVPLSQRQRTARERLAGVGNINLRQTIRAEKRWPCDPFRGCRGIGPEGRRFPQKGTANLVGFTANVSHCASDLVSVGQVAPRLCSHRNFASRANSTLRPMIPERSSEAAL